MLRFRRLAYRLGDPDKRHAELHNSRFLGIFPEYLSQLLRRGIPDAPHVRILATDRVPLSGRTAIGHVADQQPERSGRNLVPFVHRHPAACRQNAAKTIDVCEVLVAVAKRK